MTEQSLPAAIDALQNTITLRSLSRRQLLRGLAGGSVALVGGAALAACGGGSGSGTPTVKVDLTTAGWPFGAMPTKTDIAADKSNTLALYGDVLQSWLKKNPGVTLKAINSPIWGDLPTAITAGTAPTIYPGQTAGNWSDENMRAAYGRGMMADITSLVSQYHTVERTASYAKDRYTANLYNGKYFVAPQSYIAGNDLYYRRDLIKAAGLQEPSATSTYEDIRVLAKALTVGKRKGIALQQWAIANILFEDGNYNNSHTDLVSYPVPDGPWHWRYDFVSRLDSFTKATDIYRGMFYTDQSVFTNTTIADADCVNAFTRQDVAMMCAYSLSYVENAGDSQDMTLLAGRLNKPLDEVVGFTSLPQGTTGTFGDTSPFVLLAAFNPRLNHNQTALQKGYDLFDYLTFSQGYSDWKIATYQKLKDIRKVYTDPLPINGQSTFSGVPGSLSDAWGQKFISAIQAAAATPIIPSPGMYLPADTGGTIVDTPRTDAISGLARTQKPVKDVLTTWQSVWNQQAQSLTSTVSSADFVKGIRRFYAALDTLWQKQSPNFYAEFHPWYQDKILPIIGQ